MRNRVVAGAGLALAVALVAVGLSAAAGSGGPGHRLVPSSAPPAGPALAATSTTVAPLASWTGPVEHLFFHTVVIRPELAFTSDRVGQGFRDYFVTVGELRSILGQLDQKGWTLVDIHRVVTGDVRVPIGRKPFVLSEDDVNYYENTHGRGLGSRLVLNAAGDVRVEVNDDRGPRVTDEDLVPVIDEFVAQHPEFSADGAKGVLAVTGYEGLLGERVNDAASPGWAASVARAKAVADRLKATGWIFASHSYGHINFAKVSAAAALSDTERWKAEAEPIVGKTDIFIYPFGSAIPASSPTVAMLRHKGFSVLCDIDVVPRLQRANGVVVMSRRHIDGIAFQQASRQKPFFEVEQVEDHAVRSGQGRLDPGPPPAESNSEPQMG